MARRKREEEAFELNLVPMIDCMLILLIFFMVATTIKHHEKELPLELPQSGAAIEKTVEDTLLVLGIDKEGNKYIGSERVTTDALHTQIRERAARNPQQAVRIDADRLTRYEDVVEVIELCQFEGLRNVGLHTRDFDDSRRKFR